MSTLTAEEKQDVGKRYFLPRSLEEAKRMQNQHEWVKGCAGGLVFAPLDTKATGLRVLDAATADGYWIQDAKKLFNDNTEFVGFDSDPDQFPPLTPALNLVKQNLIEPFPAPWKDNFDLVHQRFVLPLFTENEVQPVISQLVSAVKPNGWIQLVEMDFNTAVSEPEDKCPAAKKLIDITRSVVSDPLAASKLPDRLKNAGLVDVDFKTVLLIAGKGNPDADIGALGKQNLTSIMAYFRSITTAEKQGVSEEEWAELPDKFSEEMDTQKVAIQIYIVWGRKASA